MIEVEIIRGKDNGIQTVGALYLWGDVSYACDTIERTYANNQRQISCIPAGKYICKKVVATEAIPYPHIWITNVSNRDGIKIHSGNLYSHSKGCVIVGKGFSDINKDGQQDILYSRDTLKELMSILPDEFNLTITEGERKLYS